MNLIVVAPNIGSMINLFLLAVAVATVTLTLSRSQLTKNIRHKMITLPYMLGELINCPYCLAHWISGAAALLVCNGFLNWLVLTFVLTGLAALFMGVVQKLWMMQETELENLRELLNEAMEHINGQEEQKRKVQ